MVKTILFHLNSLCTLPFNTWEVDRSQFLCSASKAILHICHNHHNRWLCKGFESSVKFSTWYMKESALGVIYGV